VVQQIEVEAGTHEAAVEAAAAGADIVMLDNFEPAELKEVSMHADITLLRP
jgi:nicotinate-nucleotide pyrophosphorylase (carboxylating)